MKRSNQIVFLCLLLLTSSSCIRTSAFQIQTKIQNIRTHGTPSHSSFLKTQPKGFHVPSSSSSKLYSTASTSLPEGITKTITKPGSGIPLQYGDVATVRYSCSVAGDDETMPFARSGGQKVIVGDGGMIRGWEIAIPTMAVGERSLVRIDDSLKFGYGTEGVPPFIKPNATIMMDIEILDTDVGGASVDFGSMTAADPLKPRTPAAIAAAYKARQEKAAMLENNPSAPQKEGLEGIIEKVRSFYFFGLFEGETGETPPWFLRPSITFPLAFLVVGLAFAFQFSVGGITRRGAQVTDDLDEFIISSNAAYEFGKALVATALVDLNQ